MSSKILQHLNPSWVCKVLCCHLLLSILHACLKLNYFRIKWKRTKVCIIRKAKRESWGQKSFRPTSILISFAKLLEIIILKRLTWLAREKNWISSRQQGFTEGKGTETAPHVVAQVESGSGTGSWCPFDTAWAPAILSSFKQKGCCKLPCKTCLQHSKWSQGDLYTQQAVI